MIANVELFDTLAVVVSYPRPGYHDAVRRAAVLAAGSSAETPLRAFADATATMQVEDLEESYTRTFDLDPVAALDLGWHLWGDSYERGRFLASVREQLLELGIHENGELPDHLSHVLPLVARLDAPRAAELMRYVRPALAKIEDAFGDAENVFRHAIEAVRSAFEDSFGDETCEPEERSMAAAGFGTSPYEVTR